MSTYLSEAPTYLPTIQPYQPDFQLYAGTLNMKQTQYDTAHKELSSLYGSLLNSPMLRDSNIQTRDEFFKTINYEIKKIANLDLSLKENQHQANRLFTSLYQDKNIVNDMLWTKNFQNEKNRGENFRNCFNPEDCGGAQYWDEGMMAMDYRAKEFQNATDEEALNFANVSYVPYINFAKLAAEVAKDSGLVNQTLEVPDGRGYIVETHNGPDLVQGLLTDYFLQYFEDDPRLQEMYRTKAYIERKSWVDQNIEQYGSEQAATQAYISEKKQIIDDTFAAMQVESDHVKNQIKDKKANIEKRIEKEGSTGTDSLAKAYMQLLDDEARSLMTGNLIESTLNSSNSINNAQNIMRAAESIDYSWSSFLLRDDIYSAAFRNSFIDYKVSYKSDPTWIALNVRTGSGKDDEEENIEKQIAWELLGTGKVTSVDSPTGGSVIQSSDKAGADRLVTELEQKEQQLAGPSRRVSEKIFDVIKDASNYEPQAKSDLRTVGTSILKNNVGYWDRSNNKAERKKATELYDKFIKMTPNEQISWLQGGGLQDVNKNLDETAYRNIYNESYKPITSSARQNPLRDYLNPYLNEIDGQLQYLSHENLFLNTQRDMNVVFMKEASEKAKLNVAGTPMEQFIEFAVGTDGKFRTSNQMAVAYANAVSESRGEYIGEPTAFDPNNPYPIVGLTPSFLQDREVSLVADIPGVGKARDVVKEHQLPGSRLSQAIKLATATGDAIYSKRAAVELKDENGQYTKTVSVKDFFDENGRISEKYQAYARKWRPVDNEAGGKWDTAFRQAKWGYKMGDKKDAWEFENGRWRSTPGKEKTTMLGRLWWGVQYAWDEVFDTDYAMDKQISWLEYYSKITNYDVDEPEDYYAIGQGWKLDQSGLIREIKKSLSGVTFKGMGGDLMTADFGSFQGVTLQGTVDQFTMIDPTTGRLTDSFVAFSDFYRTAKENGYGIGKPSKVSFMKNEVDYTEEGTATVNWDDIAHEDLALNILDVLVNAAFYETSKKGESSSPLKWQYNSIALGDESLSAMTVKPLLNDYTMKVLTGAATFSFDTGDDDWGGSDFDAEVGALSLSPTTIKQIQDLGLTNEQVQKFFADGITIYSQDQIMVNTALYEQTNYSIYDKVLNRIGGINIPGTEDISSLRIIKNQDGSLGLDGDIAQGWNWDLQTFDQRTPAGLSELRFPAGTDINYLMNEQVFYTQDANEEILEVRGVKGLVNRTRQVLIDNGEYYPNKTIYTPSLIPETFMQKYKETPSLYISKKKEEKKMGKSVMENVGELYMGQGIGSLEPLPGKTVKERWKNFMRSIPF